jgi:hypothetical protein
MNNYPTKEALDWCEHGLFEVARCVTGGWTARTARGYFTYPTLAEVIAQAYASR